MYKVTHLPNAFYVVIFKNSNCNVLPAFYYKRKTFDCQSAGKHKFFSSYDLKQVKIHVSCIVISSNSTRVIANAICRQYFLTISQFVFLFCLICEFSSCSNRMRRPRWPQPVLPRLHNLQINHAFMRDCSWVVNNLSQIFPIYG